MTQKRYWLRGGIVGLFIPVIFWGLVYILPEFFGLTLLSISVILWGIILIPPIYLIEFIFGDGTVIKIEQSIPISNLISVIIPFAIWFCIGAFIGWLYGKIKKRKNLS
ncbi:MAG: hypothetical protein AAB453_02365 [Patescibacteria group bacterium]